MLVGRENIASEARHNLCLNRLDLMLVATREFAHQGHTLGNWGASLRGVRSWALIRWFGENSEKQGFTPDCLDWVLPEVGTSLRLGILIWSYLIGGQIRAALKLQLVRSCSHAYELGEEWLISFGSHSDLVFVLRQNHEVVLCHLHHSHRVTLSDVL